MRAIIAGTPIEVEGEPAEIAQLVELCTTKAVVVEHRHHWKIADLDGSELVAGSCWCGAARDFQTVLTTTQPAAYAAAAATTGGKRPKCDRCGRNHLPTKACKA